VEPLTLLGRRLLTTARSCVDQAGEDQASGPCALNFLRNDAQVLTPSEAAVGADRVVHGDCCKNVAICGAASGLRLTCLAAAADAGDVQEWLDQQRHPARLRCL
jgi:hypothetical protein